MSEARNVFKELQADMGFYSLCVIYAAIIAASLDIINLVAVFVTMVSAFVFYITSYVLIGMHEERVSTQETLSS